MYERKKIMLEENDATSGLVGKYVDTFQYDDDRLEVKWKGINLPYRIFDKNQQRVTHVAVTDNKHLGAVLAYAKDIQDKEGPPKKKPAGKQRTRYQIGNERKLGSRRNSFVDKYIERKRFQETLESQ